MFLFQRLSKKERKAVKRVNALLRKRCPKGTYRLFFKKSGLRELYPLFFDQFEMDAVFAAMMMEMGKGRR